jgi:hypothetical protein
MICHTFWPICGIGQAELLAIPNGGQGQGRGEYLPVPQLLVTPLWSPLLLYCDYVISSLTESVSVNRQCLGIMVTL